MTPPVITPPLTLTVALALVPAEQRAILAAVQSGDKDAARTHANRLANLALTISTLVFSEERS